MKIIIIICSMVFSVMFSTNSYSEWVATTMGASGDRYYIDADRIRKVDGYVYYWSMIDLLKPNRSGDLSAKLYHQADCKLFRSKGLSYTYYKEPMGGGVSHTSSPKKPEWDYPIPGSVSEVLMKVACK